MSFYLLCTVDRGGPIVSWRSGGREMEHTKAFLAAAHTGDTGLLRALLQADASLVHAVRVDALRYCMLANDDGARWMWRAALERTTLDAQHCS